MSVVLESKTNDCDSRCRGVEAECEERQKRGKMAGYATRSLAFHYFPMLFLNYLMYSCAAHFDNFLVDFDAQKCKLRQEQEQFMQLIIQSCKYFRSDSMKMRRLINTLKVRRTSQQTIS